MEAIYQVLPFLTLALCLVMQRVYFQVVELSEITKNLLNALELRRYGQDTHRNLLWEFQRQIILVQT